MKKLALILALASSTAFAGEAPTSPSFDFFKISVGESEHELDKATHLGFEASTVISDKLFLTGEYSELSFDDEVTTSEKVTSYGVGLGMYHQLSRSNSLYGQVSVKHFEQEDIMLDDFVPSVKGGYKVVLADSLQLDLGAEYNFNGDFSDSYELTAGLDYFATKHLSFGAEIAHSDTTDATDDIAAEIGFNPLTQENGLSGTTFSLNVGYHF